jgi:hypothetical protein
MKAPNALKLLPRVSGKVTPETALCIEIAAWLAKESLAGRLRAVWFHVPNESPGHRHMVHNLLVKAMGRIPGAPDYVLLWDGGCMALEIKVAAVQSVAQRAFEEWCRGCGVSYQLCRSLQEVQDFLKLMGLLSSTESRIDSATGDTLPA